jgi:type IV secretory pathway VirB10-like protein
MTSPPTSANATNAATDAGDPDEAADIGRALRAQGDTSPSAVERGPAEDGPRRRLLIGLAAVAGVVLLWMLFRAVPADSGPESKTSPSTAGRTESVEGMANQSDPSWMQAADTTHRLAPAPGGVVPPVYGPVGSGAQGYEDAGDSARAGGAGAPPDSAPVPGPAAAQSQENPRRQAFLAALRSKPLQSAASFTEGARTGGVAGAEAELPAPPSLDAMDAAAQAEAERRSVPTSPPALGRAQSATVAASPSGDYMTATPLRTSGSSYVTGGAGGSPQQSPAEDMAVRRSDTSAGRVVVPVGTVIEGQLHTAVSSDLPGGVVGMVTRNVYDVSQRVVVIPRYSWLYGTYESDVAAGQTRLVVQWTAIRFPNGDAYGLPALRAGDRTGASGLQGRVDNHYGRIFGHALLSSVMAAGFESATGGGGATSGRTRGDAIADATAQEFGQTASEVTRRNLNIKPTITVPRLTRFSILLDRDLLFPLPAGR